MTLQTRNFETNLIKIGQQLRTLCLCKDFKTEKIGATILNI